jgi:hypothetical protein
MKLRTGRRRRWLRRGALPRRPRNMRVDVSPRVFDAALGVSRATVYRVLAEPDTTG